MLVIKNYIFPCIFCIIVFCSDLVSVQGQATVITATQDAILTEGEELQLECNISISVDNSNFRWLLNGNNLTVHIKGSGEKKAKFFHPSESQKNILIIRNGNATNESGVYTCKLNFSSIEYSKNISVWSVPAFMKLPASLNKVEGDSVLLTCKAYGLPAPEVWWGKQTGVLTENDRIRTTNGTNNATLEITNLESEDRDNYVCYALNNATNITQEFTVLIRVKDKLAALWPFLGICAEVAILCTIIFIYEKRRSKEELEEEEPNQEEKTVSNSNQKDKDIRQRK